MLSVTSGCLGDFCLIIKYIEHSYLTICNNAQLFQNINIAIHFVDDVKTYKFSDIFPSLELHIVHKILSEK